MNTNTLIISVITGAIGTGYFVYGKNQKMIIPTICGIILGIYPYFTDNLLYLSLIGFSLIIIPFIIKF